MIIADIIANQYLTLGIAGALRDMNRLSVRALAFLMVISILLG